MFETVVRLSVKNIEKAVDALESDGFVGFRVDPTGPVVMLRACKKHEVDAVCVRATEKGWQAVAMRAEDRARLAVWSEDAVPRVCARWKKRYPWSAQTGEAMIVIAEA